jgi:hypothetical protein
LGIGYWALGFGIWNLGLGIWYLVFSRWNAKGWLPKDAVKKIDIFYVQDQTASAKLTAHWGTDYFQLAKTDGKWMIINILWQGPLQQPKP